MMNDVESLQQELDDVKVKLESDPDNSDLIDKLLHYERRVDYIHNTKITEQRFEK